MLPGSAAAQPPSELRYHLKPGDHLIYRETFEAEGRSPAVSFHTRWVFVNHLVVLQDSGGMSLVGVQRNRQSAELLEYRENGSDRLAQQNPSFQQRVSARPAISYDANLFSAAGWPRLPIQVVREVTSDLLFGISELAPLPAEAVGPGSRWTYPTFSLPMQVEGPESVNGHSCIRIADVGARPDLHIRSLFCPDTGVMQQVTLDGTYSRVGDAKMHDRVSFELIEARHGESVESWLHDPQTQQGVLAAYLVGNEDLPQRAELGNLVQHGDPAAQALALAVSYQRGWAPSPQTLSSLQQNANAEVRRIATGFLAPPEKSAQPCDLPEPRRSRQKFGTTLRSISSGSFTGTPYVVHVPIEYRPDTAFPLIVYLSGGIGRALDAAFTAERALGHSGYIAVYPQAGGLWWESRPTQMFADLLPEVLREFNIDTNRVYLGGSSNGATGAMHYAALWPQRFAAVASLMGAGVQTPSSEKLAIGNLLNVPVLLLHGDKDERIPSSASSQTYDALKALHPRVAPEFHILKNRPHDITLDDDEGYTLPFFARFQREPWPRQLSGAVANPTFGRQYWVEVIDKTKNPAEIDARISGEGAIEVKARNAGKLRLLLRPELTASATSVRIRLNGKDQPAHELTRNCTAFGESAKSTEDPWLAWTDALEMEVPK